MEVWGLTDPGLVRSQNQDYFLVQQLGKHDAVAVVCDGMGGAKSGNVASKMAADMFLEEVRRGYRPAMTAEQAQYERHDCHARLFLKNSHIPHTIMSSPTVTPIPPL